MMRKFAIFMSVVLITVGLTCSANAALSAKGYVTDGLIGHWDGIENVSYGAAHDNAAAAWADLTGKSFAITKPAGASFQTDGLATLRAYGSEVLGDAQWSATKMYAAYKNARYTCEIAFNQTNAVPASSQGYKNTIITMLCLGATSKIFGGYGNNQLGFNPVNQGGEHMPGTCATLTTTVGQHSFSCQQDGTSAKVYADSSTKSATASVSTPATSRGVSFNKAYYSDYGMNGTYHAIRFYDRALAENEVAWNRMIDQHRFFGAALDDSVECATHRVRSNAVEVKCTVNAPAAGGGTVSITSGSQAGGSGEGVWAALDSGSVTYTATADDGKAFIGWTGDVDGLTVAQRHSPTLTITADAARSLTATFGVLLPLEYLESSGTQYIDTGVNFTYGHRFTLRWAEASKTPAYDEDKGWGTGGLASGNDYNITGGGRQSGTYAQPYIFKANRNFSPTLLWADLEIGDQYEDVVTVTAKTSYVMTRLANGRTYAITPVNTPNTTAYNSGNTINLFSDNSISYRYNGKKRIYRATYETVAGKLIYDLFPATLDGVRGMYDRVSCTFFPNAGSGNFLAGPEATWFRFANGDVELPLALPKSIGGGSVTATVDEHTYTEEDVGSTWLSINLTNIVCTAIPGEGASFVRWDHGWQASVTTNQLVVAMDAMSRYTAQFVADAVLAEMEAYVQDGLFAQWDGVYNVGYAHDAQAETWTELKSNLPMAVGGTALSFTDNAAVFDNAYMSGTSATALQAIRDKAFTVEMSVTPTSYERYSSFFSFGNPEHRILRVSSDSIDAGIHRNLEFLEYRQTGWNKSQSVRYLHAPSGFRSTVAVVCDGSSARLYVDGVLQGTSTVGGATDAQVLASTAFYFGVWGNGSYLNYRQDMRCHGVRFYNRALSAAEVAANATVDRNRHAEHQIGDTYVMPVGNTAIDTGYVPNANSRIVLDSQLYAATNTSCRIFGVEYGNVYLCDRLNSARAYGWRDYTSSEFNSFYPELLIRAVFAYDNPKRQLRSYVGVTPRTNAFDIVGSKLDASGSLYLFATHNSATTASNYSSFKFYSLAIYEGDTLVKCFVPYTADSRVGLKDLVSGDVTHAFVGDLTLGRDDIAAAKTVVSSTDATAAPGAFPALGTGHLAPGSVTFTAGTLEDLGNGQRGFVDADGIRHVYSGWEMNRNGVVSSGNSETLELTLVNAEAVALTWKWENMIPVAVTCDAAVGTVTLNGTSGTAFTNYVQRGVSVQLSFTPKSGNSFGYWTGLPRNKGFTSQLTTLTVTEPIAIRAYPKQGVIGWTLNDYISDGLTTWFDAKSNSGSNTWSSTATSWVNLVPSGDAGKLTTSWSGCWHDDVLDFNDKVCLVWQSPTHTNMTIQFSGSVEPYDYEHKTTRPNARLFDNSTTPIIRAQLDGTSMRYYPNNWCSVTIAPAFTNVGFDCQHVDKSSVRIAYAGGKWNTGAWSNMSSAYGKRPITTGYGSTSGYSFSGYMRGLRVYDRLLTDGERAVNALIDRRRYAISPFSGFVVSSLPRALGTSTPAVGVYEGASYVAGTTNLTLTGLSSGSDGSYIWLKENEVRALFKGWRAIVGGVETSGATSSTSLTLPEWGESYFTWKWEIQCLVTITASANAPKFTVNGGSQVTSYSGWVKKGSELIIKPVGVTSGYTVGSWTGAPDDAKLAGDGTLTLTAGETVLDLTPVANQNSPKYWTGASSALASNAGNWVNSSGAATTAPVNGDAVILDAKGAAKPMTWDLDNVSLASWTQTADYSGTVTFLSGRADRSETHGVLSSDGNWRELVVAGNVELAGGVWTHQEQPTLTTTELASSDGTGVYRLIARVGGNFTLVSNATNFASINLTAKGFKNGQSPGNGSHGGQGTGYWGGSGNKVYGKVKQVRTVGSSMGGTAGGGNLELSVTGSATINGRVWANGGPDHAGNGSSCAGGGIWITANSLTGKGEIVARPEHPGGGGGAGGGRISLMLTGAGKDFSGFTGKLTAHDSGARYNAGTIYMETAAQNGIGDLLILGNGQQGDGNWWASSSGRYSHTLLLSTGDADDLHFHDIILTNGVQFAIGAGAVCTVDGRIIGDVRSGRKDYTYCVMRGGTLKLTNQRIISNVTFRVYMDSADSRIIVGSGSAVNTLLVDGSSSYFIDRDLAIDGSLRVLKGGRIQQSAPLSAQTVDSGFRCNLAVSGNVTIDAGGSINVTGQGTPNGYGYRGIFSEDYPNGGGYYGGMAPATGGQMPYGSIFSPTNIGSGGKSYYGGGAIKLFATGSLQNDGAILANGSGNGGSVGTGAGGSIWLRMSKLTGSGIIEAHGGDSTLETAGGNPGSGGRISLELTDSGSTFTQFSGNCTARGGAHTNKTAKCRVNYSGAGTICRRLSSELSVAIKGEIVIDNETNVIWTTSQPTMISSSVTDHQVTNLKVANGGWLSVQRGETLEIAGELANTSVITNAIGETADSSGAAGTVSFVDAKTTSRVTGTNIFTYLSVPTPGKTVQFGTAPSLAVIAANGMFAVAGANATAAQLVKLRSVTDGTFWPLQLMSGAKTDITCAYVKDSDARYGLRVVVNDTNENAGNNKNWSFLSIKPGDSITWNGQVSSDWADPDNWEDGNGNNRTPVDTDVVSISKSANNPQLPSSMNLNQLSVDSGASLDLCGYDLTVTNGLTVQGSLLATESTITLAAGTRQSVLFGESELHRIVVSGGVSFRDAFTADAFSATATGSDYTIEFAEDCTYTLDSFAVDGVVDNQPTITLASSTKGNGWKLKVASKGWAAGAIVSDSEATGIAMSAEDPSTDAGNNHNWVFGIKGNHWTGGGDAKSWTDLRNWSAETVPDSTSSVHFDSAATVNLPANSTVQVRTFEVDSDGGLVIINAVDTNTCLVVDSTFEIGTTGSLELNVPAIINGAAYVRSGGKLSHSIMGETRNAVVAWRRVNLTVNGDLTIESGGEINTVRKGYNKNLGSSERAQVHGGRLEVNNGAWAAYGSVFHPVHGGESYDNWSGCPGGGVVRLVINGKLTVNGTITSEGYYVKGGSGTAGGSVWINTDSLAGSGQITTTGGKYDYAGGNAGAGGRVAIYVATEAGTNGFTGSVSAMGGSYGTAGSRPVRACGTIYWRFGDDVDTAGIIVLDNGFGRAKWHETQEYTDENGVKTTRPYCGATDLPVSYEGDDPALFFGVKVIMRGDAHLYLTSDLVLRDLVVEDTSDIFLNGYNLDIFNADHKDRRGWSSKTYVLRPSRSDSSVLGNLRWRKTGISLIFR